MSAGAWRQFTCRRSKCSGGTDMNDASVCFSFRTAGCMSCAAGKKCDELLRIRTFVASSFSVPTPDIFIFCLDCSISVSHTA
jgi:hypothetical protein